MEKLTINDLPKALAREILKQNGEPTRKHNLTKDEVRGFAVSVLNQVKGLKKSDVKRVLAYSRKMLDA